MGRIADEARPYARRLNQVLYGTTTYRGRSEAPAHEPVKYGPTDSHQKNPEASPRRSKGKRSPSIGPPTVPIEKTEDGDKDHARRRSPPAGGPTWPGYMGLIANADKAVKESQKRITRRILSSEEQGQRGNGGGKGNRTTETRREAAKVPSSKNERSFEFSERTTEVVTQPATSRPEAGEPHETNRLIYTPPPRGGNYSRSSAANQKHEEAHSAVSLERGTPAPWAKNSVERAQAVDNWPRPQP